MTLAMNSLQRLIPCVALVACASCEPGSSSERPNVVLVVVDTLRADHMSLHGYERPTTPRLDAFAAESAVVFEQARSAAPWTKPSVASIFTGLDSRQHRVLRHIDALHSSFRTLAQTFGENGWQTHGIQSNPYLVSVFGFEKGFINYEDDVASEVEGGTIASYDLSTGEQINAQALEWVDRRTGDTPFFLYVHHYEPHHMYLAEEAAFMPAADALPEPARRELLASLDMDQLMGGKSEGTADDVAYLAARYDSEILLQDRLIGELLDGLRSRGLLGNSVVVITADHGEEFLEHGDFSHQNYKLFDELLRVPLVISAPGIEPSRREEGVGLVDLGKTLLGLCGLESAPFPGDSFASAVRGTALDDSNTGVVAYGMLPEVGKLSRSAQATESLVMGRWKLIRDVRAKTSMLFDLETDPGETNDLAQQKRAKVLQLEKHLAGYLDSRGGIGPPLVAESAALLEQREEELERMMEEMKKLGYIDEEDDGEPAPTEELSDETDGD